MDGVKVALANRWMTVEAARQCNAWNIGKSGEPGCICNWMSFHSVIFAWPVFFGPPSHALVVITWRGVGCRYMMRFCKLWKGRNYSNSRRRCQVCGLRDDCVCVVWLDITTPPLWRETVRIYYYYFWYWGWISWRSSVVILLLFFAPQFLYND